MQYFMESIGRVGIFIICAQVLVHFKPKASYEQYLKMLVSAMILIQLLMPVCELFTGEGEQSLAKRVEWFEKEMMGFEAQLQTEMEMEEIADEKGVPGVGEDEVTSQGEEKQSEVSKVSVTPIAPVEPIQIRIGKGDEPYADFNSGDGE